MKGGIASERLILRVRFERTSLMPSPLCPSVFTVSFVLGLLIGDLPMAETRRTIDYYFWLMSDWAYLGGVRFVQIAARHGVPINHIPMRMPDVYAGSGGILLHQRSWQRQAYRIEELKRWRARLGIHVNIEPKFFPVDIDLASCLVIAGQQRGLPVSGLVNALMQATWAEDRDQSDPAVLADICQELGLNAAGLLAAAHAESVVAEYQGNTARALAAGVFGSPFYLFAGERFWGQDRLDMLEEAIVRSASGDLGRTERGAVDAAAASTAQFVDRRAHYDEA